MIYAFRNYVFICLFSDGNRDQSWGLTNRQTEFLLRNLEDAAHLLKVLKHSSPYDQEDKVPTETASDTVSLFFCLSSKPFAELI